MKITLDLDTNEIVVPKNFFKNIDKQNETIVKMGGQKISGIDLIKKSILSRAFRGDLGTNDQNEESAVELLKRLQAL